MARFFFHLHECGKLFADDEGRELSHAAEAVRQATIDARDLLAHEVKKGKLCLGCHIEVVNGETGEAIIVPFREVIEIVQP